MDGEQADERQVSVEDGVKYCVLVLFI